MNDITDAAKLVNTVGNSEWLSENQNTLRLLISPDGEVMTWKLILQIGFKLKLLGANWRTEEELVKAVTFLCKIGIYQISKDFLRIRSTPVTKTE